MRNPWLPCLFKCKRQGDEMFNLGRLDEYYLGWFSLTWLANFPRQLGFASHSIRNSDWLYRSRQ